MSSNTLPNLLNKKNVYKLVYDFNSSQNRDRDDERNLGQIHRPVPLAQPSSSLAVHNLNADPSLQGHRIPSGSSLSNLGKRSASYESNALSIAAASTAAIQNRMRATRAPAVNSPIVAETGNHGPSDRQRLAFYLDTSHTGRFLELGDAILSLVQCLLYIFNTIYVAPPTVHNDKLANAESSAHADFYRRINSIPLPQLNRYLELLLAFLIFGMFTFRLYIAPSRSYFLTLGYAVLSLVSTIPVMMAHLMANWDDEVWLSYMSAGFLVYVYPFRWARLHEVISVVLTPVKDPIIKLSAVGRKASNVSCAILLTLLSVSAFIHIAAYKDPRNTHESSFFDVFYFTVMSSTSGLNNSAIQADSWFTRALLLYILIAGAFYIPTHLSELLTMIRSRSKFTKPYSNDSRQSHVIVTGTFEASSLMEFLREFFCPDHGPSTINTFVVMLNPSEPSEELVAVLQDPAYMARTKYIKGSATSFRTLNMAAAKQAKAIFIMANHLSSEDRDLMIEDAETVMRALAIKKYNHSVPIFVESLLPENQSQFHYLSDEILCLEELKLGILSQSCRVPGFCTFVSLLSTSMTEKTRLALVKQIDNESASFLKPYVHGASQEIYACRFPATLIGKSFHEVTRILYCRFGACLIGLGACVDREELPQSLRFHIVLNPSNHLITGTETGFIIGEESEVVDEIMEFDGHLEQVPESPLKSNMQQATERTPLLQGNSSPFQLDDDESISEEVHRMQQQIASIEASTDTLYTPRDPDARTPTLADNLQGTAVLLQAGGPVVLEDEFASTEHELDAAISNHIILCDAGPVATLPSHLHLFFQPIRDPLIAKQTAVVVLSPLDPPESIFSFADVYYVRGSPVRRADLIRAGVERAKKLVVLCGVKSSMRTADAGAILCALNAESAAKNALFPVVEFVHRENFKFISDTEVLQSIQDPFSQIILRPSFMAGHVFSSTLLDGLLAQCYYSSHILSLLKRLIFTCRPSLLERLMMSEMATSEEESDKGKRGKGRSAKSKMQEPDTRNENVTSILPIQKTCVHQIDVPPIFVGRHYRRLYSYLAQEGIIVLGLYRRVQNSNRRHPLSMSIINPRPMVRLHSTDKIFILCNEVM